VWRRGEERRGEERRGEERRGEERRGEERRGEERYVQVLVGKPERKRPHGRLRCISENNIKMNLQEIRWGGLD
jgi:hypothetical protein